MIELNVHNERSQLEIVVLGIPNNFVGVPNVEKCYDPKSKQHILDGTFPIQKDVSSEILEFLDLLT